MHAAQSSSSFSFSTMSTLEQDLLYHEHESKDVQEKESSFPMLYFEFDLSCLSSDKEAGDKNDENHDDQVHHDRSRRPQNQSATIPNLQIWQQSDHACCGSSLNEPEEEFSVSLQHQESLSSCQEGEEHVDDSSHSSSSYSLSSHDEEHHHRSSVCQQGRQNMAIKMTKAERRQGCLQQLERRKVRRSWNGCSGINSVDLASCPRVNRQPQRRSTLLGTTKNAVRLPNKKISKVTIPSEIDSIVISMNRLSKQKHKEVSNIPVSSDDHGPPQEQEVSYIIDSS